MFHTLKLALDVALDPLEEIVEETPTALIIIVVAVVVLFAVSFFLTRKNLKK